MRFDKISPKEYNRVHRWLRNNFGNASKCVFCFKTTAKRFEWALKTGCEYDKTVNNFLELCPSCHRKYDLTDTLKQKIIAGNIGRTHSKETKNKMSLAAKKVDHSYLIGRKLSDETRTKISVAMKGKPIGLGKVLTEEHRKAISEGMLKKRNLKNQEP